MTQRTLFEGSDLLARARTSDPITSHQAAAQVEASGRAGSDRSRLLTAVRERPGLTAGELSDLCRFEGKLSRHDASKRLAELRHAGLVVNGEIRVCKVHGTKQMEWSPV